MFVDRARIYIKAGTAETARYPSQGKVHKQGRPGRRRRRKRRDVIFVVDEGLRTLQDFRYKTRYRAEDGKTAAAPTVQAEAGRFDNKVLRELW